MVVSNSAHLVEKSSRLLTPGFLIFRAIFDRYPNLYFGIDPGFAQNEAPDLQSKFTGIWLDWIRKTEI